jgi:lipid II:glycine glycyltransferase (peptidoglycan interpeptide bridge formation enzyme)
MPAFNTARAETAVKFSREFSYAVNASHASDWSTLLDRFRDANLFQTQTFGTLKSPRGKTERFVVLRGTDVVAAATVRVTRLPWPAVGCAYVLWGPVWRPWDTTPDAAVWREAIRALRSEYVVKRKLWLRLRPMMTDHDDPALVTALKDEGFREVSFAPRQRTMLIDLSVPLDQLRKGLGSRWRNYLNNGEREELEIVEGVDDALIDQFVVPFRQMVSRKGLSQPGDIQSFRALQRDLPTRHKMRVFLARSKGTLCAGAIASHIGERGIYHFGALGNSGMHTKASYVLQWRIIEWLKRRGCAVYDLHGVSRLDNPGGYQFKSGLCGKNGKEVEFVGTFDAVASGRATLTSKAAILVQERRKIILRMKRAVRSARGL